MNDPYPTPPPSGEKSETIGDTAREAWESTKEKAGDALHSGERYVRENPGTSVLSIFGFGFVLGLLVGWSVAHETHDTYARRAGRWARGWGDKLNFD